VTSTVRALVVEGHPVKHEELAKPSSTSEAMTDVKCLVTRLWHEFRAAAL
jgi:hypothetical protein